MSRQDIIRPTQGLLVPLHPGWAAKLHMHGRLADVTVRVAHVVHVVTLSAGMLKHSTWPNLLAPDKAVASSAAVLQRLTNRTSPDIICVASCLWCVLQGSLRASLRGVRERSVREKVTV